MPDRFITSDAGGVPVIAGTHVTVEAILRELADSDAVDAVLTAHPELDRSAVQAALAFAAEKMHDIASAPPWIGVAKPRFKSMLFVDLPKYLRYGDGERFSLIP